jgi:hypothetical protein
MATTTQQTSPTQCTFFINTSNNQQQEPKVAILLQYNHSYSITSCVASFINAASAVVTVLVRNPNAVLARCCAVLLLIEF